jgi:hypothetical protein
MPEMDKLTVAGYSRGAWTCIYNANLFTVRLLAKLLMYEKHISKNLIKYTYNFIIRNHRVFYLIAFA